MAFPQSLKHVQTSGQRYGVKLKGSDFRPGAAWQAKGWSLVSLVWAAVSRRQAVLQGWTLRCSIDAILAAGDLFCKLTMHTGVHMPAPYLPAPYLRRGQPPVACSTVRARHVDTPAASKAASMMAPY